MNSITSLYLMAVQANNLAFFYKNLNDNEISHKLMAKSIEIFESINKIIKKNEELQ